MEVFLATTALEQFWDTNKPIIFLGDWCCLHERRRVWERTGNSMMKSPFEDPQMVEETYIYLARLQDLVLEVLADSINKIHHTAYGRRYWKILLGPWLQSYMAIMYDRYIHLVNALKQYPFNSTIGLKNDAFVIPEDTLSFASYAYEDSFNLQIFTKLLDALDRPVVKRDLGKPQSASYLETRKHVSSLKKKAAGVLVKKWTKTLSRFYNPIVIKSAYFSKSAELALSGKSCGKIVPTWFEVNSLHGIKYSETLRFGLKDLDFGVGDFEKCLSKLIYSDVPKCFLEGYKINFALAQRNYPKSASVIFSANGWYYDEIFKQWAALAAERGTRLLGSQHGGNYGTSAMMPWEDHETSIVDYFYSWGWERKGRPAAVIPMPATKLTGRSKIGSSNESKGILWVGTSSPRYLTQFPYLPHDFHHYLRWQSRFAAALGKAVLKYVRFRPHVEDHGWGVVERLRENISDIVIESWDRPFEESLRDCRLYVCDHLSTTFIEALAADKPTILFWNSVANKIRPEALPYYELLRQHGILFDSPEEAALAICNIYQDVETWWGQSDRRAAVNSFSYHFARTSNGSVKLWAEELKKMALLSTTSVVESAD